MEWEEIDHKIENAEKIVDDNVQIGTTYINRSQLEMQEQKSEIGGRNYEYLERMSMLTDKKYGVLNDAKCEGFEWTVL